MELIASENYVMAYTLLEEVGKNDVVVANKYDRAIEYIASEDYEKAYSLLYGMDFEDSSSQFSYVERKLISMSEVGSYVAYGSYEQDYNTNDGKEKIEWLVLEKDGGNALLISKYVLDHIVYSRGAGNATWDKSYLREWLNDDFINTAFSTEEQKMISSSEVTADSNLSYNTKAGENTNDKVYILSVSEVWKYLKQIDDRKCQNYDRSRYDNWWIETCRTY